MGRPWAWLCDVLHVGSLSKREKPQSRLDSAVTTPSPLLLIDYQTHPLGRISHRQRRNDNNTLSRSRIAWKIKMAASNADNFGVAEDLKRCDNDTGERLSYTARQKTNWEIMTIIIHHPAS